MCTRLFILILAIIRTSETRLVGSRDFDKVKLDKEGYEKVRTIHYNWYLHSMKAIMGQLGKDVLPKLSPGNRRQFLRCLDGIVDKRDLVSAARCLIEAKEKLDSEGMHCSKCSKTMIKQRTRNPSHHRATSAAMTTSFLLEPKKSELVGPPMRKLNIKLKRKSSRFSASSQGSRYSFLSKKVSEKYKVVSMNTMPALLSQKDKSVASRVTRMITSLVRRNADESTNSGRSRWTDTYKSLLTIKKALDKQAKQPGAKVYDLRMFDLVLGNDRPTRAKGEKSFMPSIVQDAYKLIHTFERKSKDIGDSSNIKFLSPRFAPIMPDKADIRGSLSPSVLSFYKDDTEEQLLPIPKLLEATGMSESDREDVLEMVMETTGARQLVDDAMKTLSSTELFGMQGELKEVTERMTSIFKELEQSFDRLQKKDIKRRGFTFLNPNQLEELHGNTDIVKHAGEIDFDVKEYSKQTRADRERALWSRIAAIAANGTNTRSKRQITWLSVSKPTVLSPYMFSPVFGLTVLGPVVLSPSLFSPLLLNPAVLSPYVLSPAVGMPFIISPYLLSPYVLSPLVMAPFILNPYVLSPNVINPYVLSPLILSPLVLCPDLVSPMVLGGSILSPGVLSPSVLSKSFLMVSVLSPTVLS
uniref:WSD domain-containing protein n=1 Tax=Haemonchus contortus TaxID=6289 RepID=A0A7I4Y5X2_HAECO